MAPAKRLVCRVQAVSCFRFSLLWRLPLIKASAHRAVNLYRRRGRTGAISLASSQRRWTVVLYWKIRMKDCKWLHLLAGVPDRFLHLA